MLDLSLAWWALPLFFVVAMLYASVGHGGASGYLALFAFLGAAKSTVVPIALILNILVAGIGFVIYLRSGFFSYRLLLPFIVSSVPAAFIGGWIHLSSTAFGLILGSALVVAALRLLVLPEVKASTAAVRGSQNWAACLFIGLALGLIAGMIGIGGGVFLSPILLFLKWADAKQAAAVSSAFIVLNSLSGLAGHLSRDNIAVDLMAQVGVFVLAGSVFGSYWGARRIRPLSLQVLLGVVLLIAGGKLLVPLLV